MLNKNISIWRGIQTPPTNYHLWEKEDGGLYIYLDEKWQHLVTPTDKITLDEHQKLLDKIKNLTLTEINPTDNNTYKSYLLKSDDNIFGETINIPKDRFIKLVALGYNNATIDESTGIITIGTGLSKEYLLFSVALLSGSYELVSINLPNFFTEKDYSDGLEVVNNKLKVKVDPSSEEYLEVSNNGIKVEGINTKVSDTVEDIKTKILNGEWLSLRAGRDTDNNIKLGAIAEGTGTTASGENSHAEGHFTTASGKNSYASGNSTNALGENSHAEGSNTHAKGVLSHTEGLSTKAIGNCSHALGALNYDDSSFIDMVGIGGNASNSVIEKNAAVIYVGRDTTGLIDVNAAKNGYQYLIDVGGYQGQEIGDAKSVQEVFADINNVLYTLHARVTLTASPTIIEKGVSTAINLSWLYIYNDKVIIPTSMELKSNNNVLENIKYTYTDTINNTKTYLVTAINEGVTNTSNIITVNAYYPMYFGEGSNIFNQIEVITIDNKRPIASSPRGDVSIAFTGGKYLWLCIPSTMNITKVTSSGFTVPMEAPITLTIHESYKCYRSTDTINKGTVNFTILDDFIIKDNTIKTSEIDFTTDTLQKFNNSISSGDHVIKTQYSVVDTTHDNIVGQMLLIGDSLGHMVTEILTTSAELKDGVIDWNAHSDTEVNTYIRRNHVKEGGTSSIAVGSWSKWTYYSGEGQYNDFKILVTGELSKKVNTSDVVQQTGNSTTSVMSQKTVTDAIQAEIDRATTAENAILYDASAHNDGAVFESLQALLSSSNLSTLIPPSVRHGGMSIKFIQGSKQSSDNKYVQYRLIATSFSTTVADWQGVDDEPTTGSNNLVKSGGVEKRLSSIDGVHTYVDKKVIYSSGVISDSESFFISIKIPIKSGDTIFWKYSTSAVAIFFCVFDQNDNALGAWNGINGSNGERTFKMTYETVSYAIASFDRDSNYTPLVKVNGKTVWEKIEKGAIELIKEKIVTDNFPSFGSNNLVKSNGIFIDSIYTKVNIDNVDIKEAINNSKHNGYVDNLGNVLSYTSNRFYSDPILLKAGYMISTELSRASNTSILSIAQGDSVDVGDILTPINGGTDKTYKATEDVYIVISGKTLELNKPIYITNVNAIAPFIGKIDKDFYGIGNTVHNKYIGHDGTIHDDNDWNIISLEVNQNDSVTWVVGALKVNYYSLVLYDINDNLLTYWNSKGVHDASDSRTINFSDYPNAHHIIASFSKFLMSGDENTTPLVINGVGVESIDRTAKGTYDAVKELNKKVSEIYTEPYDEYGAIGINYPSEVKKVIEDIDKNISGTKLHFCHVSDNHGSRFGYANEFTELSPAKFLVNTGDLVVDKFSDSFDTPKGLILAMNKPGFIVLGNHDVYKSTSLQERFEKYFAPLNEHNGLTGNTKTYYSVDYPQEKVKCIFLDMNDGYNDTSGFSMSYFISMSKMSSEQINWFAQELINAKSNNLHVACFIHVSPDYVNYEKSPIDFYDYQAEKATNVAFLCDMIDKFIEGGTVTFTHNEQEYTFNFVAGGHFVGWFCGHRHCDCSGWMLNHPKQFSISVPRPGWNSMKEDGTYRIPKLGITFNYVTIDTKFQRLGILRMGNNKTIWGTPREGFSIRYN